MKNTFLMAAVLLLTGNVTSAADFKEQLILALHQDQRHRGEINRLKKQHHNIDLIQQLEQAQAQLDQGNLKTLDNIINQLGHWPGIDDVGKNPASIALILFKRSELKQQARYLPLMHTAVLNKQIPAIWYAEAHDHHLMLLNKPQKFGHLMIQSSDGKQGLYPIESLETVNNERSGLGLPDLKTTLGQRNILLRTDLKDPHNPQLLEADKMMSVAELAAACLDQIYPNSIKHVLNSKADAASPDQLYPAFFGCFDWHSSVHGHWLLVRAAKLFPNHAQSAAFMKRLDAHFQPDKLTAELTYFQQPGRAGFERPYGLAWFLQLYAELHEWQNPQAQQWRVNLTPLKNHVVKQLSQWIPKLAYPIRTGEHSQTAFAFGLAYDYAVNTGDEAFANLLKEHVMRLYLDDKNCPINYEPSGQDFLSACLAEADLMRRMMTPQQFAKWFKKFIPASKKQSNWLPVARVTDRVDGKLAHLDGLNIARAWMLEGIAMGLPLADKRRQNLGKLADMHAKSGLAAVTGEHYAGGHWLGSFAVYYLSQRGLP